MGGNSTPATRLIGIWRLVATRAWDGDGNPMPAPYGPQPQGLVSFHRDRRMMCVLADGRPAAALDPPREYVSYMGEFVVDGATLCTRVDGTSDAPRLGTDQVRDIRFEGERLVLTPPPRPRLGQMEHRELTWERLS